MHTTSNICVRLTLHIYYITQLLGVKPTLHICWILITETETPTATTAQVEIGGDAVLYLLAAVIPLIVLHFFHKGTVVERLRTSE